MDYQQFIETIKVRISGLLGPSKEVIIKTNLKLNSTKKIGLLIKDREGENTIIPTIYLEEYYQIYLEGMAIDEIADDIILLNSTAKVPRVGEVEILRELDKVRDKIMYRIINKEKNMEMLSGLPHREYLDWAICYYIFIGADETGGMTIKIENKQMIDWRVTEEELYQIAKYNTKESMPLNVRALTDIILNGAPYGHSGITEDEDHMYGVTNMYVHYGAATILCPETLHELYKKVGGEFYLFPSSVHDVIICKTSYIDERELLMKMVTGGNEFVANDEYLSDNVYYYNQENGLTIY